MNRYLALLRSEPLVCSLSLLQLISYFGVWFSNVAIYTLLIGLGVSELLVALTAVFHFLPGILQAPFSGVLADRFSAKKVMLATTAVEIIATLGLLLIAQASQVWLLYALIVLRVSAATLYFNVEMALLPKILEGEKLQMANELHAMIWSLSYTVGMAVSGLVVYVFGTSVSFVIDASLYLFAWFWLWMTIFPATASEAQESAGTMLREGIAYLRGHTKIIYLMLLHASVGITAFDALVALMAERYYQSVIAVPLAIGLLNAFRALGLIAGPPLLGRVMNVRRLFWLLVYEALALMGWGAVQHDFWLSLVLSVLVGFGITTLWSFTYTLLQKQIDQRFYGRVVAYNDMIFVSVSAATALLIGILTEAGFTTGTVTALMGTAFLVYALYYAWIVRRIL